METETATPTKTIHAVPHPYDGITAVCGQALGTRPAINTGRIVRPGSPMPMQPGYATCWDCAKAVAS